MADVKCCLYEINKNNRANATHGQSPVQRMFRDQTEAMLDWRGPVPGPVLTLMSGSVFSIAVAFRRLNFSTAFSTNAVSICQSAGLMSVKRVEQSTRYLVHFGGNIRCSDETVVQVCCSYQLLLSFCYRCLLYTSPSPRDGLLSRMPSSA